MEAGLHAAASSSSGMEPGRMELAAAAAAAAAAADVLDRRRLRRSSSSRSSNSGGWAASAPAAGTVPPLHALSPSSSATSGSSGVSAQRTRLVFKPATRGASSGGSGRQATSWPTSPAPAAAVAAALARPRAQAQTCCQVDGCQVLLQAGRETYNGRYRVCQRHIMEPAVVLHADRPHELYRFCNQCFRFERLACFDGEKRGCRVALAKRRERSRSKRLARPQAAAGGRELHSAGSAPEAAGYWTACELPRMQPPADAPSDGLAGAFLRELAASPRNITPSASRGASCPQSPGDLPAASSGTPAAAAAAWHSQQLEQLLLQQQHEQQAAALLRCSTPPPAGRLPANTHAAELHMHRSTSAPITCGAVLPGMELPSGQLGLGLQELGGVPGVPGAGSTVASAALQQPASEYGSDDIDDAPMREISFTMRQCAQPGAAAAVTGVCGSIPGGACSAHGEDEGSVYGAMLEELADWFIGPDTSRAAGGHSVAARPLQQQWRDWQQQQQQQQQQVAAAPDPAASDKMVQLELQLARTQQAMAQMQQQLLALKGVSPSALAS